ncbi:MAG TPA: DUF3052 family protein [Terriglobales bacterium]|jgi:hypothetical protein
MAGYSGTPLAKKLGLKEGLRIALPGVAPDVRSELKQAIAACEMGTDIRAQLDFVLLPVRSQSELKKNFASWAKRLAPAGVLWVSWPKKSSGIVSDLDENKIREIGLAAGLVDVKVCAVSEVWSGLKFVVRLKDRVRSQ